MHEELIYLTHFVIKIGTYWVYIDNRCLTFVGIQYAI